MKQAKGDREKAMFFLSKGINGLLGGVFLLSLPVLALTHLSLYSPALKPESITPFREYDPRPMQEAMKPDRVREKQSEILSLGSRFLGQEGFYETEALIKEAFERAGLEVYEQEIETVAPETAYREIYLLDPASGTERPLREVEIFPFMPNHAQPVVTPEEGLSGELVLMNEEALRERNNFDDVIGLIDSRSGRFLKEFEFNWKRYAALGMKAIIVSHSHSLEEADWSRIAAKNSGMVSGAPVNFVRLAATPSIFQFMGERVRLRVRVNFVKVRSRTLLGRLRAKVPTREALLVTSAYDALSVLPDRAPGALSALSTASQLQLLEGLLPYRETLRRDLVFVAFGASVMGRDGLNQLLILLQKNSRPLSNTFFSKLMGKKVDAGRHRVLYQRRLAAVRKREEENAGRLSRIEMVLSAFGDPFFMEKAKPTRRFLEKLDRETRTLLEEQFTYLLNTIIFARNESMLQAKLAFEALPGQNTESEAFREYRGARTLFERTSALAGYRPVNLLEKKTLEAARYGLRNRLRTRFEELLEYHRFRARQFEEDRRIVQLFKPYDHIGFIEPSLVPAPLSRREVLSLDYNEDANGLAAFEVGSVLSAARTRLGIPESKLFLPALDPFQHSTADRHTGNTPKGFREMLRRTGYHGYGFVEFERLQSYRELAWPVSLPTMRKTDSLRFSFAVMGETVLALAHGSARFQPELPSYSQVIAFKGRVLASNVGNTVVPNYPLKNALVLARSLDTSDQYPEPGFWNTAIIMTNPYGNFDIPETSADLVNWSRASMEGNTFTPIAVAYGEDGLIAYMKDEGENAQRLFKTIALPIQNNMPGLGELSLVLFRASPVSLLDLINPQNLKEYSAVNMITSEGLSAFDKFCHFRGVGIDMTWLEPDKRFYVELKSGAPGNEWAQMTRAFMLGDSVDSSMERKGEINGKGYLPAKTPFLLDVPVAVARSMASVNGKRLALQNRYGMADARTNRYHERVLGKLEAAAAPDKSKREAMRTAREAVTYATLNHPVLREAVFEAVLGILWYLALLVPFVFFFEKLIFCFPDVRRQLCAQVVIFLLAFSLLRFLHPAFQMVRSSLMILLGFIIIMISGGITILFSGRFQENLEELRKKRGKAEAAEVNALGVIMTALMIGLNNMHRRKMRTGLTCVTLILITFAMIFLTSTSNDLVEEDLPLGRAPYEGFLIKREDFLSITESELEAVRDQFGDRYDVCPRRMLVGDVRPEDEVPLNPGLEITHGQGAASRKVPFDSILRFSHNEPLRKKIALLTRDYWFPNRDELAPEDLERERAEGIRADILIPEEMASALGIFVPEVNRKPPVVFVNGRKCRVRGIFSSASLDNLTDLDGHDLLPFNIESMKEILFERDQPRAGPNDPRISASRLLIADRGLLEGVPNSKVIASSIAVSMPAAAYGEARRTIEEYMEQSAETVFYGLDGTAWQGSRKREVKMSGMVDLIIPLLIAALTVLNTMRGSVYERRDEIQVYNSVGIAPKYIFIIFFGEALVYAVVGSVLGYLLSQGVGRILLALGLTGGMNMTFASLTSIYASLIIIGAVFLSTWHPARTAMEISAPAEEAGWTLPEPVGGALQFDLPFNFRRRGRIAVLEFFDRYLRDHGEGGMGRYSAGLPQWGIRPAEDFQEDTPTPFLSALIWLKPFDRGVSQKMVISLPHDPETTLFKAVITLRRLSGTRASWMRLNRGFVTEIRRHFLHWRAVEAAERESMFVLAREKLAALLTGAATERKEG